MFNCIENDDSYSEKQIIKSIDLDLDMDTNIRNIAYLGKIKQHLSNI